VGKSHGRPRKHKSRDHNEIRVIEARESQAHSLFIRRGLLRQGIDVKDLLDPRCSDPLGLYLMTRQITVGQYNSGVRYRHTAMLYRKFGGFPSGLPKLIGVKGLSLETTPAEVWEAIKQRYLLFRHLILQRAGRRALYAVHEVCAVERSIDGEMLVALRLGLRAITRGRKFTSLPIHGLTATGMSA
jgi:hypothetical protein